LNLIPMLSMALVGATMITLAFALFSYAAFRYRELKAPRKAVAPPSPAVDARFFRRYRLSE